MKLLIIISMLYFGCQASIIQESSYNPEFKNYAKIHKFDTAILIIAYNRPDYFKLCLESIKSNPESNYMPIIFSLDGGPNSKQAENLAIISTFGLKNVIVLMRNRNYGCPKNHIDSKRFAFEWCKFKKLIVLEDDVIVSPHYITFNLNLYSWATRMYTNIGTVQSWTKCFMQESEKRDKLNVVRENPDNWSFVSYCIDYKAWDKIKTILYQYESFIDEIPITDNFEKARSKPALHWKGTQKIRDWVRNLTIKKETLFEKGSLKSSYNDDLFIRFTKQQYFKPHQDAMMGFAIYMNDLVKIQSTVNRCITIGETGISTNQSSFVRDGYDKVKLDVFEADTNITSFELTIT